MIRVSPLRGSVSAVVCGPVALALSLVSLPAQAQHATLSKHVPEMVSNGQARRVEAVATTEKLDLVLSLPLRNQSELDGVLADLYNSQSPNFHHWLTPGQFDARFGPTAADYAALTAWAQQSGLTVTATSANRHILSVRGSVKFVDRAFNIEETTYHDSFRDRDFRAPDREPSTSLSVPLLYVSGLDTSNPKINHLMKKPAGVTSPSAEQQSGKGLPATPGITGSGPGNTYLPSDMRAAYYGTGSLTGTGQTVAIFSYDGYIASDLTLWHSTTSTTSSVPVTNVLTGGFDGGCELDNPCDDGEQILDIVQVQGMAPGLAGITFYEGLSAVTEINQMLEDNVAKVITSSWSGGDFGPGTAPQFIQMAAQGITYLNATGDSGGYNGFTYLPPGLDPNIVEVGGTDLNTTGAGGPWASETAWVDSGGGYFDPGITIPAYQQASGVITSTNAGSTTLRNSPDMAAEANFDNTTVINGKFESGYGGTSYATPRMAGYVALANQQSVANGYSTLGFINPQLYQYGLSITASQIFHDITSGSAPSSSPPTVTYSAVAGYDLVTGWGSPVGAGLINALTGADFALTPDSTSLYVARGTSITSNVTVTNLNGYAGQPPLSFAGLPAGVTASYTFLSNTSIQMTFTSAATTLLGTTPITVTGTSGSITHSFVINLTTGKRANDDFTISATSASAVQMASGSSVVSVTPGMGLSGPVTLMAGTLPAGVTAAFDNNSTYSMATLTFTVGIASAPGVYPITITGTAGGSVTHSTTVNLTITAVASALSNGGGETGALTPWTFTSTLNGGVLCDRSCGYYPHSGSYFFYINGFGATDTDVLSQQFTVSGGSTSATLNFWLWINSAETTTTAKNDTLTVAVYNTSGTLLGTLAAYSNLNKTLTYAFYSYDMTPYLGQTVVLKFTGVENRSRATAYLIDDVSVVVR
jgi:subtilase family serine protease